MPNFESQPEKKTVETGGKEGEIELPPSPIGNEDLLPDEKIAIAKQRRSMRLSAREFSEGVIESLEREGNLEAAELRRKDLETKEQIEADYGKEIGDAESDRRRIEEARKRIETESER